MVKPANGAPPSLPPVKLCTTLKVWACAQGVTFAARPNPNINASPCMAVDEIDPSFMMRNFPFKFLFVGLASTAADAGGPATKDFEVSYGGERLSRMQGFAHWVTGLGMQSLRDSLAGVTVPQRRYRPFFCVSLKNLRKFRAKASQILANQNICSHSDRDRSFRVRAQGQARHTKIRCLFLDTPRVGNDHRSLPLHGEEFNVRQGLEEMKLVDVDAELFDALACPWMNGKHHFQFLVDVKQRLQNAPQGCAVIDIGRAMEGDQSIAFRQTVPRTLQCSGKKPDERIDHHVADPVDFLEGNAFAQKVDVAIFRRSKQHIGKPVGDNAVNLFRHSVIERTQSGLDVGYPNHQFRTHQSGSYRGIHVSVDQDHVRFALQNHRFKPGHHFRSLPGVAAGTHFEVYIWLGDVEL